MRPAAPQQQRPSGGGNRGGGGSTAVIAIGAVVAVIAVIAVIVLIVRMGSSGGTNVSDSNPTATDTATTDTATSNAAATTSSDNSGTPDPSVSQGAQTRTIEASRCADATKSYLGDGNSVYMPDFYTKYVDSVKSCMDEAGWKYKIKYQDESVYGKGTVVDQKPQSIDDFNPDKDTVTIWVSTGKTG
jgi:hypothetical protein